MNTIRERFGTVVVVAVTRITEEDEEGLHVHAEPGDRGEVIDAFPRGTKMVQWFRSGGVVECFNHELRGAA